VSRRTCITFAHRGFSPSTGTADPAAYADDLHALVMAETTGSLQRCGADVERAQARAAALFGRGIHPAEFLDAA